MPETALTDRNDENELCECQLFPLVGGRSLISIFVAFSLLIFHRKGFFFFPFALARGRESGNGEPREASSSAIWSPSLFCSSCRRRLPFPEKAETRPAVGTAPVLRGRRQREKSRHDMTTTTTTSVLQSKATERKQLSSKARQEKSRRSGAAVTKISPASP